MQLSRIRDRNRNTVLNMGEAAVRVKPGEIICYGLGSCVGVFLYDKFKKIGAAAHIMLPSNEKRPESDQMLFDIIENMLAAGSHRLTIRARIVGGASVVNIKAYDIGLRNIDYVRQKLKSIHILITAEDVGGNESRTAKLNIDTGILTINTSKQISYTI